MTPTAERAVRQALVGLGSNLGDRAATLAGALTALRATAGVEIVAASPVFETAPVGLTEQPAFLNQVVALDTTLAPEALLAATQAIEQTFGRRRLVRWGPRTLDLDLLAYEGETRATERLALPHPRMLERAFVIVPLRELLREPRVRAAAWTSLRRQLESLPLAAEGVRLFSPPPDIRG